MMSLDNIIQRNYFGEIHIRRKAHFLHYPCQAELRTQCINFYVLLFAVI